MSQRVVERYGASVLPGFGENILTYQLPWCKLRPSWPDDWLLPKRIECPNREVPCQEHRFPIPGVLSALSRPTPPKRCAFVRERNSQKPRNTHLARQRHRSTLPAHRKSAAAPPGQGGVLFVGTQASAPKLEDNEWSRGADARPPFAAAI